MKFCDMCQEEFAGGYSFCPIDGTSLRAVTTPARMPAIELPPSYSANTHPVAQSVELGSVGPAKLRETALDLWLRDLLRQAGVPSVPARLNARVLETYMQIVAERAKAELKKLEAEIEVTRKEAEANLKQRRLFARCIVGTLILFACVIAFVIVLLVLGRVHLPAEFVYILLGLLGPAIGKGVLPYRRVREYFLGETTGGSDSSTSATTPSILLPDTRQPEAV